MSGIYAYSRDSFTLLRGVTRPEADKAFEAAAARVVERDLEGSGVKLMGNGGQVLEHVRNPSWTPRRRK